MTVLFGGPHDGMAISETFGYPIEIPEINPDLSGPQWRYQRYKPDGTYEGVFTPPVTLA